MPPRTAPHETGVLDPRQINVPLLVVVPVVAVLLSSAIWGARKLDQTAADIAAIRAALPGLWSVANQREWAHQLGKGAAGLPIPDVDEVKRKIDNTK